MRVVGRGGTTYDTNLDIESIYNHACRTLSEVLSEDVCFVL